MSFSRGARAVLGIVFGLTLLLTLTFVFAESLGMTDETWIRDTLTRISEGENGTQIAGALIGGLLAGDLVLPVPSSILMTLAGFVCGTVFGTAVSFLGAMLSALIGFHACRRWGRGAFASLVGEVDLPRMERALNDYGAVAILLSRSVPMLTEIMSCLAGLSSMSSRRFLFLSAAGTLPICAVYAWAGEQSRGDASLVWPLTLAFLLPAAGYLVVRLAKRAPPEKDPTAELHD